MWERLLLAITATLVLYLSLGISPTSVNPGVSNRTASHLRLNLVVMPKDNPVKINLS